MNLRALVVGVSDYSKVDLDDLPFCMNDIKAVSNALVEGLAIDESNIITLGNNKIVTQSEFRKTFKTISDHPEVDTFIFYFSGHGGNLSGNHHLSLSDGLLKTQDLIQDLENIPAKNKIIILDTCMSGNFKIEDTAKLSVDTEISDFFGKGYAVISSSNSSQESYGHREKPVSLFTSFLCEALEDKLLVKKGRKSLYDIQKLLFLYLEIWNKNNPYYKQNPIFRENLGGTILFPVENYTPYKVKEFYDETEDYIIYAVEPMHGSMKRYSVKVILKNPLSIEEISLINSEIVEKVKKIEIYQNEKQESRWRGKNANIIFCNYGRDETDMITPTFLCRTTWVDENQDKEWWYKRTDKTEMINGVHFNYHSYYEALRIFQRENTGEKKELISQTKEIISQLVTLAEKVIREHNEFLNGTKSEQQFIDEMKLLTPEIDKWYIAETELPLAPKEIKEWCSASSGLVGTIHDFTLFYNEKALATRSFDNRIKTMNITKERYYEDLERLRLEENVLID